MTADEEGSVALCDAFVVMPSGAEPTGAADAFARSQLRAGEHLLWAGQPDVRAYALQGAWYLIPFSLIWGGFAIFWELMALQSGGSILFALWGLPFVTVGLYLIFGRILVARREARRTVYGVTDRRVLLLTGAFRQSVTEMAIDELPVVQLEEQSSGVGRISFSSGGPFFRPPPGWPMAGMYGRPTAFESIRDASRVYHIIQDAKAASRRT